MTDEELEQLKIDAAKYRHIKAKALEYQRRPEVKAKITAYIKKYQSKPEVKERYNKRYREMRDVYLKYKNEKNI